MSIFSVTTITCAIFTIYKLFVPRITHLKLFPEAEGLRIPESVFWEQTMDKFYQWPAAVFLGI